VLHFRSRRSAAHGTNTSLLGLVDPAIAALGPVDDLLSLEPEVDLVLGTLSRVGAVADVAADVDGEVTTDGAGGRVSGVGGTEEDASRLDHVEALPDHGDDGARREVLDESGEEGLSLEVVVVLSGELGGGLDQLEGNELESLARND